MFLSPLLRPWLDVQCFHSLLEDRRMTFFRTWRNELAIMDVNEPDFSPVENDEEPYLLINSCARYGEEHVIVEETFIPGVKWLLLI